MAENENKSSENAVVMNPGEVITPGNATQNPPAETTPQNGQLANPASEIPAPTPLAEQEQTPALTNDDVSQASQSVEGGVSWVGSEFILHEKTPSWYAGLAVATLVLSSLIYLITKDVISVAVILIGAATFGIYASRKPRQLPYQVSDQGVQIGNKDFGYHDFRGFSIVQEGAFSSIVFTPLKRFSPLTTIYYPPEQETEIVDIVANHLPVEERKQDPIDTLMHKIGF